MSLSESSIVRTFVINTTYTEGDTLPAYSGSVGQDITGWVITFRMRRSDGTLLSLVATHVDEANGDYAVTFGATDLLAGLHQPVEIEFNTGSGVYTENGILFSVRANV